MNESRAEERSASTMCVEAFALTIVEAENLWSSKRQALVRR